MNTTFMALVLFDAFVALIVSILLNREHRLIQGDRKRHSLLNKAFFAVNQNPKAGELL